MKNEIFQKIRQNWKKSVGMLFNKILLPKNDFFAKSIITIDYQLPIAIIFVQRGYQLSMHSITAKPVHARGCISL